jgi:hypothetical protein
MQTQCQSRQPIIVAQQFHEGGKLLPESKSAKVLRHLFTFYIFTDRQDTNGWYMQDLTLGRFSKILLLTVY